MRLIDTHLHLWDPNRFDYAWLDAVPGLRQTFGLAELADASIPAEGELREYVFMQADCAPAQAVAEVDWVAELAEDAPIRGIIAFAPVEDESGLDASLEHFASRPLVKGVRRLLQSEPAGFSRSEAFLAGARRLTGAGLTFDACVTADQLEDVAVLARAVPDLRIVLDHLGKPTIGEAGTADRDGFDRWRADLGNVAAEPNVCVKLSGLPAQATASWTTALLTPYLDAALDAFGAERTMFGSDWPASSGQSSYQRWIEFVQEWLEGAVDDEDAQRIRFMNAQRVYRLPS
ncbi:amidohydrolase family protein [Salinibacterium sp. G-O1]|uniref:amidohydrolase family protein n=1 Tax=Salinibacterium sp. G-O1 TaxID=3046208 RepID=UPI0024BA009B|nr:amidohydrolase family protein [Salinibacterium sp. G-O1]MDJ0335726.1 amidohydrolase family protein [Salinibacterium sp. G-O1]